MFFLAILLSGCGEINSPQDDNASAEQTFEPTSSSATSLQTKLSETVRPPDPSHSSTATFKFSCTPKPCSFQCKMDASDWKKCSSPKTYTGLSDGEHTFKVRAKNSAGKVDQTPAKYSWTIITRDYWTPTSTTNAPLARQRFSTVWTGTQMIVWGGYDAISTNLNSGGIYDPLTDSWTATSTDNAPEPRSEHNGIWAGSQNEMMVWGGYGTYVTYNNGGRYNPSTNSWSPIPTAGAPSARANVAMVWTGTEMIVYGGQGSASTSGARFNPSSNSWTALPTENAPVVGVFCSAVWTGTEMIAWGGDNGSSSVDTGGRYNPTTNSWTPTPSTNAPSARYGHTAVWTGTEMLIFGGFTGTPSNKKFNPGNNAWYDYSPINCPSIRWWGHTAVWTGSEMVIWGGYYSGSFLGDGGKYNPSTNSWSPVSMIDAPGGRSAHGAVWTGSEMIIWGGCTDSSNSVTNTGGRYKP